MYNRLYLQAFCGIDQLLSAAAPPAWKCSKHKTGSRMAAHGGLQAALGFLKMQAQKVRRKNNQSRRKWYMI